MSAKAWIFCEKQLTEVDPFVLKTGKSGCFERLERKSKPVFELLQHNNDWRRFILPVGKNFGLNTNGKPF
jgi:hypothetical protein